MELTVSRSKNFATYIFIPASKEDIWKKNNVFSLITLLVVDYNAFITHFKHLSIKYLQQPNKT